MLIATSEVLACQQSSCTVIMTGGGGSLALLRCHEAFIVPADWDLRRSGRAASQALVGALPSRRRCMVSTQRANRPWSKEPCCRASPFPESTQRTASVVSPLCGLPPEAVLQVA